MYARFISPAMRSVSVAFNGKQIEAVNSVALQTVRNFSSEVSSGGVARRRTAPSAYALFIQDKAKGMTNAKPGELMKKLATQWRGMSEGDKQRYTDESKKLKEEHQTAVKNMSLDELKTAMLEKLQIVHNRRVTAFRKEKKELKEKHGFPKATSDYFKMAAFASDKSVAEKLKQLSTMERTRKVAEMWQEIPKEKQEEYERREREARRKYRSQIKAWTNDMEKRGLGDIVKLIKSAPKKLVKVKITATKK